MNPGTTLVFLPGGWPVIEPDPYVFEPVCGLGADLGERGEKPQRRERSLGLSGDAGGQTEGGVADEDSSRRQARACRYAERTSACGGGTRMSDHWVGTRPPGLLSTNDEVVASGTGGRCRIQGYVSNRRGVCQGNRGNEGIRRAVS